MSLSYFHENKGPLKIIISFHSYYFIILIVIIIIFVFILPFFLLHYRIITDKIGNYKQT